MFNGAHPSVKRVRRTQFLESGPATSLTIVEARFGRRARPTNSWSRTRPHREDLTDLIVAEARLNAVPSDVPAEARRLVTCPSPVQCLSGDSNYAIVSRPMGAEQTIGQRSSS